MHEFSHDTTISITMHIVQDRLAHCRIGALRSDYSTHMSDD